MQIVNSLAQILRIPRKSDGAVPVLAYHFTGQPGDWEDAPYTISTELFDAQMRCLLELGYESISLRTLADSLRTGSAWPGKGVVITFDDGRACSYRNAFPILKKYRMRATVFLLSSKLQHPNFLSVSQIHEMEDHEIEFESHGHSHVNFSGLTTEQMQFEIEHSKAILEKHLRQPVSLFAFPYGGLNPAAKEILIRAGYAGAVCSRTGRATPSSPVFEIPRLGMRATDTIPAFIEKLSVNAHNGLRGRILKKLRAFLGPK